TVPMDQMDAAKKQLVVEVESRKGEALLHWSAAEPVDGNKGFVSAAGVHEEKVLDAKASADELFQAGVRKEKEGRTEEAVGLYAQVLAKDPAHVPALLTLAERDYRAADF